MKFMKLFTGVNFADCSSKDTCLLFELYLKISHEQTLYCFTAKSRFSFHF